MRNSDVPLSQRNLRILGDGSRTRIWLDGEEITDFDEFEFKQAAGECPELTTSRMMSRSEFYDNTPEPEMTTPNEITREEQAELIAKMMESDGGINAEELSEREKLVMLSLVEGGTVVQYTWFDRLLLRMVAVAPGIVGGMIGCMIWQILF